MLFRSKYPIDKESSSLYLSKYLYKIIENALRNSSENITVEDEIRLVNDIVNVVVSRFDRNDLENSFLPEKAEILKAVIDKDLCDKNYLDEFVETLTPINGLTSSVLFTGSQNSVNMVSELKREIRSSDEIRLIVSFIMNSGVNLIYDDLKNFVSSGKKLKIITTTYTKNSDFSAIRKLALLPNTEIKISYNGENDRLHAKSYVFLRQTGFHTAYIGSSNLSAPALTSGMEWNVKATYVELPHIIDCVSKGFETCWEDETFQTFVPGIDDERLKNALDKNFISKDIDWSLFDLIRAKDYQQTILDKLTKDRVDNGNFRNLLVAATGTGKTVISAFDYKRFREERDRSNILFIAHREEILRHALDTFRNILEDENFGELWLGGSTPKNYIHLFASKDTVYSRMKSGKWNPSPEFYDYIIIDEAHHIIAETYRPILEYFKPIILLGMTATPERNDGDIKQYFDGGISAEIRLAEALRNRLLSPFHYYGITDSVDLSAVNWKRGQKYVESELTRIYTSNDRRTRLILKKLEEYAGRENLHKIKAIGFCVSREHASYMDAKFRLAGLKSAYLTSDNSTSRRDYLRKLEKGDLNFLFVVDMFNEGIDIPSVDTIMFLRQTESLTVYLQQFGRGLRKAEGKEYVTILDFVGNGNGEFHYSERFREIIGKTGSNIKDEISNDFPILPFGCTIELEREAQEYILSNIEYATRMMNINNIKEGLKSFERYYDCELSLKKFIEIKKIPLSKIYNKSNTFSSLCIEAGVWDCKKSKFNLELSRAVSKKWLSTDSFNYFSFLGELAEQEFSLYESDLSEKGKRMALMLYYDLFQDAGRFDSLQNMFDALSKDDLFISEFKELIDILKSRTEMLELEVANPKSDINFPLRVHGRYTKDQITVALGTSAIDKKSSNREGVERNKEKNIEVMYVDLIKNRIEGSTTNYDDIAISQNIFDWQSQNSVSDHTVSGKNYINGKFTMLLFVREQALNEDKNRRMGYVYLGEVTYVSHYGNAPMNIRWKLKNPMPASLWQFAGKLNSAL